VDGAKPTIEDILVQDRERKYFKDPRNKERIRKGTLEIQPRNSPAPHSNYMYSYTIPQCFINEKGYYFHVRTKNANLDGIRECRLNHGGMVLEHLYNPFMRILQVYNGIKANELPFSSILYGYEMGEEFQYTEIMIHTEEEIPEDYDSTIILDYYYDPKTIREPNTIDSSPKYIYNNKFCIYSMYYDSEYLDLEKNTFLRSNARMTNGIIIKMPKACPQLLILENTETKIRLEIPKVLQVEDVALYKLTGDDIREINDTLVLSWDNHFTIINDLRCTSNPDEESLSGIGYLASNVLIAKNGVMGTYFVD
jgi:hypothetical protein